MSQQRSRFLRMIGAFWMIVLVCGALPGTVLAADDQDRDDATLIGAWRQSIIFPGVPVEFFDVIAFHEDGTVTEQFGNRSDGSAGIGVWKKVGRGTFAVTFENFGDRNHDGTFDVRFRIRLTYHVIDRNTLTATGTSDTFSVDGTTEIAPSFPGVTIQATRMHVVRE